MIKCPRLGCWAWLSDGWVLTTLSTHGVDLRLVDCPGLALVKWEERLAGWQPLSQWPPTPELPLWLDPQDTIASLFLKDSQEVGIWVMGMLPSLVATLPCSEPDKLAKWDSFLFLMGVHINMETLKTVAVFDLWRNYDYWVESNAYLFSSR